MRSRAPCSRSSSAPPDPAAARRSPCRNCCSPSTAQPRCQARDEASDPCPPARGDHRRWMAVSGSAALRHHAAPGAAEHEPCSRHHAQCRPQVVQLDGRAHVEHRERHEHGQRDDLLQDLQLRQGQRRVADAVGRHLQQVFEQAMPQLTSAAMIQGRPERFFRCAYQAKVMNTLDSVSRTMAVSAGGMACGMATSYRRRGRIG